MLCRQTIKLHKNAPSLPQALISREMLMEHAQANQILALANEQANQVLSLADEKRRELLEQTGLEIWQRADAQLKRWESERQAMCNSLERHATSIANQAIRCLLEDTTQPERLAALLKQLLASQLPEIKATLLCHPHEATDVKQWLANKKTTLWTLQTDDSVSVQTLVLKTDEGDFHISWSSILDSFQA